MTGLGAAFARMIAVALAVAFTVGVIVGAVFTPLIHYITAHLRWM